MNAKKLSPPADLLTVDYPVDLVGWYQPHPVGSEMTRQDNLYPDPKTGELVYQPSMTKQGFKDECDINIIVKRAEASGTMELLMEKARQGVYADLPDPIDYQEAIHQSRAAQEAFMTLPAAVRSRFENDPAAWLAFMGDPANQQEIIDMGLAVDKRPGPEPAPTKVEIVNPVTPESPPAAPKK